MSAANARRRTALRRLADAVREFDQASNAISLGGLVTEANQSFYRVRGIERHVALGDRVSGEQNGTFRGEIISVGPLGAVVKPFEDRSPAPGAEVYCEGPVRIYPGDAWRGRVLSAFGEPIDGLGAVARGPQAMTLDRAPPPALSRKRIDRSAVTGVRSIDIFAPVCIGQRIGIFAGSGVGKSTLLGMVANTHAFDEIVVGLIGERGREVREFIEGPLGLNAARAVTIVATGDESALMRRLAARTAMTVAEHFSDQGKAVLLILDSVTRFAQACREIAITAGEPAVSRGFPPSVFSELARLLERAGQGTEGAGSITGVFSVLVDGDDHNDPIADSTRGILDGHIVLDRAIADQGRYPAINLLTSLSRLSEIALMPDKAALTRRLRAMVARFEDTRDLRAMGGYQPGVDADLDACVAIVPRLYAALNQTQNSQPSVDAFREVAEALRANAESPTESDARVQG